MVMTWEIFYHELWVGFRLTSTVLCIYFACLFWNKRRKIDFKDTRMILLGQGLFLFCFGLTRTLFAISDYFTTESGFENLVLNPDPFLYSLFWKLAAFVGILGIVFLLVVIESYLVKTHYLFTCIATIGMIIALSAPDLNFSRWVTYITLPIAMIGAIFIYFYLVFKGSGVVRRRAGISIVGLILLGGGTLLGTTAGVGTLEALFGFFPKFISVLILTAGLAIYTYINAKE